MTKYDIHVAIAKAMGWTKIRVIPYTCEIDPIPSGYPPGKNYECNLPSYTVDLNAMAAPEASLSDDEFVIFFSLISAIWRAIWHRDNKPKDYVLRTISASAAQRAEAWLKVKNLWVEDAHND